MHPKRANGPAYSVSPDQTADLEPHYLGRPNCSITKNIYGKKINLVTHVMDKEKSMKLMHHIAAPPQPP